MLSKIISRRGGIALYPAHHVVKARLHGEAAKGATVLRRRSRPGEAPPVARSETKRKVAIRQGKFYPADGVAPSGRSFGEQPIPAEKLELCDLVRHRPDPQPRRALRKRLDQEVDGVDADCQRGAS
jgi:hypothetical protein